MTTQADQGREETPSRTLPRAVAAVGLVVLTVHFVCTAIYINPISVLGLAWRAPITAYIEPLFRQRWSLFAPDPPMFDRRLDYQCEIDGAPGPWASRSDNLLETHARRRFSPAGRLRRLETAAIVATVGSQDEILDALLASQDQASDAQRGRVEDLFARRLAASIVASETAYRLILGYCREDLGREPDHMRYRIVTKPLGRSHTNLHNLAVLACVVQICIMYFTAGLAKVPGKYWQNGTAFYYVLASREFGMTGLGPLIWNNRVMLALTTWGPIVLQLAFPWIYVFGRAWPRRIVVLLAMSFHVGILVLMGLDTFALIMVGGELLLLSDGDYEALSSLGKRLWARGRG